MPAVVGSRDGGHEESLAFDGSKGWACSRHVPGSRSRDSPEDRSVIVLTVLTLVNLLAWPYTFFMLTSCSNCLVLPLEWFFCRVVPTDQVSPSLDPSLLS